MRNGDMITVIYGAKRGEKSGGYQWYRLQIFSEKAFEFKVLADVCTTGVFLQVAALAIGIEAGLPVRSVLVAPTLRRPGEVFSVGPRAEDLWGNATGQVAGQVRLEADGPVDGLPVEITLNPGCRGHRVDGLKIDQDGITRFRLIDDQGQGLAQSNPLAVRQVRGGRVLGRSPWAELSKRSASIRCVSMSSLRGLPNAARTGRFRLWSCRWTIHSGPRTTHPTAISAPAPTGRSPPAPWNAGGFPSRHVRRCPSVPPASATLRHISPADARSG